VKKKRTFQEVETTIEPVAIQEPIPTDELRENLEEIKTYDGVIGYIMRNTTSATIDLKDPAKIIEYALLSSASLEASDALSGLLNLGKIRDTTIEGKSTRLLSLVIGENKISVFMEKTADCDKILTKLKT
jgi:predicted regulator of Ras-like GTPase activity (Roadblock/LC7/MglB family)